MIDYHCTTGTVFVFVLRLQGICLLVGFFVGFAEERNPLGCQDEQRQQFHHGLQRYQNIVFTNTELQISAFQEA